MKEIETYSENIFESIKHIDEEGKEYWLARELYKILEYGEYRKFLPVIKKAIESCKKSNQNVNDHFVHVGGMVDIGSKAKRKVEDYKLSRYACYLIVQNGDSRKEVIALGQTYFAIQTRKQELLEGLSEDEKRLRIRRKVKIGNYGLNQTAVKSGVKDLARFTNAGYKGLYNGETADDIFKRKKLRYREDILDNMCSEELADNLFRIMHTESKLLRDKIDNEYMADAAHYEIGKEVRNSIERMGGTMPEELPNPNKSIKEIEKDENL